MATAIFPLRLWRFRLSRLPLRQLLCLLACSPAAAAGSEAADACRRLAGEASISVAFQDREVRIDETRDTAQLNALAGKGAGSHHHVFGLTHAVPEPRIAASVRWASDGAGRYCALPQLAIGLGFSELEVYLARELASACHRRVVLEHEEEHVAVWRQHLRAGGRLIEARLRRELLAPGSYASLAAAEAEIRARVGELLSAQVKALAQGIETAQRDIDSPASYARVEQRLRACPGNRPLR